MFNMTALRMILKKAEKRKINAPEKLQFKMICWNFRKRDLSELISENLQSTNNCQHYFLINWNLIKGLLLSTNFNQESTAGSQTFATLNTYFSFFFFRKCSFKKLTMFRINQVQISITRNVCFALHYGKQIGVSPDKYAFIGLSFHRLLAQISTLYTKVW